MEDLLIIIDEFLIIIDQFLCDYLPPFVITNFEVTWHGIFFDATRMFILCDKNIRIFIKYSCGLVRIFINIFYSAHAHLLILLKVRTGSLMFRTLNQSQH
jgi:hypothetical protein